MCYLGQNTTLFSSERPMIYYMCDHWGVSWRSLCEAGDQISLVLNASDSCLFVDTHTHQDTTPQEAFRGHTAFSGFQRSSRESKDRLDHLKRRSANSSPLPGVGRSLKIVRENIVVWHVCLIVNSIWSILIGVKQMERYLSSRTRRRRTRSVPSRITYWFACLWRIGSFQYLLIMYYLFWKKAVFAGHSRTGRKEYRPHHSSDNT